MTYGLFSPLSVALIHERAQRSVKRVDSATPRKRANRDGGVLPHDFDDDFDLKLKHHGAGHDHNGINSRRSRIYGKERTLASISLTMALLMYNIVAVLYVTDIFSAPMFSSALVRPSAPY